MAKSTPSGELIRTLTGMIKSDKATRALADAVPPTLKKYLTPDRMARVALQCVAKTPALWDCTPESIMRSIVEAASVGIEPTGGVLAHGYLVPFKRECTFMIGYRGYIELARRSGSVAAVVANPVYENDHLVLRYGFDADFSHEPCRKGDRGPIIGAYCMAVLASGEKQVTYLGVEEIEKRRNVSRSGRGGPWGQWYAEMCVKTVVRHAAKMWPLTHDLAVAADIDARGDEPGAGSVVDAYDLGLGAPEPTHDEAMLARLDVRREMSTAPAPEPDEAPPAMTPEQQAADEAWQRGEGEPPSESDHA